MTRFDWMSCALCGRCLVQLGRTRLLETNPTVARDVDLVLDGRELDYLPLCRCVAEDSRLSRQQRANILRSP